MGLLRTVLLLLSVASATIVHAEAGIAAAEQANSIGGRVNAPDSVPETPSATRPAAALAGTSTTATPGAPAASSASATTTWAEARAPSSQESIESSSTPAAQMTAVPPLATPRGAAHSWPVDAPEAELPDATEPPRPSSAIQRARWFLGVDRLALAGFWNVDYTLSNSVHVSENGSQATLVGGSATTGAVVPLNVYAIPRLSVDYVAKHNVTFGLGATFHKSSGGWDIEQSVATASGEGQQSWLIAVAPRMGFLMHVTPGALMWIRVGGTLSKQQSENPTVHTDTLLGSFDLALSGVFRVVDPLALVVSLDLSLPFDGITKVRYDNGFANRNGMLANQEFNAHLRFVALQFGTIMYL